MKDVNGISLIKGNIGETYTVLEEYNKAYQYLFDTLIISEKLHKSSHKRKHIRY